MSLELGRSSAARDDNDDSDESTEAGDTAAADGARQPDDATADGPRRRSVLAPFMAAGSADDSPSDEASGNAPGDAVREDDAPRRCDTVSPSATGAGTTAPANAVMPAEADSPGTSGAKAPAIGPDEPAAGNEEGADSAPPRNAKGTAPAGKESATAARLRDAEPAATSDAADTTASDSDGPTTSDADGATTSDAGATAAPGDGGPAAAPASSVPAPRSTATAAGSSITAPRFTPEGPRFTAAGPRTDSVGLAQANADVDGPLLGDAEELRANWLRLQAGFVDDPREAVSDAADLVEHAAQALVGALRLRQQKLRGMWDGGRQKAGSGRADAGVDEQGTGPTAAADSTEQLRLLIKRYRVLFNQICRS